MFAPSQLAVPALGYGVKAVPIFAALSGFLIYLSARDIRTTDDIRVFAFRRLLRIMPVYILTLLLITAMGRLVPLGSNVNAAALFVSELFMLHAVSFPAFLNPVTWSLYVELIFYMFVPIYILCVAPKRRILAACIGLAAVLFPASFVTARTFDLWPFFFFGILAAEIAVSAGDTVRRLGPAKLVVVGAALVVLDLQGPEFDVFYQLGLVPLDHSWASIGLGLGMFLLMTGLMHAPRIGGALDVLPLRILGAISYSLFLVHPIYLALNFPDLQFTLIGKQYEFWKTFPMMPSWYLPFVFFPGLLLWAAVMFVLVEKPFIAWGRRNLSTRTKTAPPAITPTAPAE